MANDNRRHVRIPHEVTVTMNSENNFYTGFTQDISEGGVFVATKEILPLGTKVEFELGLGKGRVKVAGEVRWIRERNEQTLSVPGGIGISFTEIDGRIATRINDFILKRRDALFYDDDD